MAKKKESLPTPVAANSSKNETIDAHMFNRMLSLQESKLKLEAKQIELNLRELDNNSKMADKAIEAQAEDRKDARKCQIKRDTRLYIFIGLVIVAALFFASYAIHKGEKEVVFDLLKILAGFAGGYGVAQYRRNRRNPLDPDQNETE